MAYSAGGVPAEVAWPHLGEELRIYDLGFGVQGVGFRT
jgi:hypothetical protein